MNAHSIRKFIAIALSSLLLTACIGGDDGIIGTGFTISGTAEKGPFVIGSTVTVNELTPEGQSTGTTYNTQTLNSLGDFAFTAQQDNPVQITVDGYHFNELTSQLSQGPLTLRAIYDVQEAETQTANVNVMTHLIHNRVLELISAGSMNVSQAITQAQNELQAALSDVIGDASIQQFTNLRVYDINLAESEGNAYLLTLSATLYQYATTLSTDNESSVDAELTLLLNQLSDDLSSDGDIDATEILGNLYEARLQLNAGTIESNLEEQSIAVKGSKLDVPNIIQFIGQVLITNPANNAQLTDTITVRTTVPTELAEGTISLLVDGEIVEQSSQVPHEFTWNPYFWSATNSHSLLISANIGGNQEIYSNLVTVLTTSDSANQFNPLLPENGTTIKDSNQIELSWIALASAVEYEIQLSDSSEFTNIIQSRTTANASVTTNVLETGNYYWRARASNQFNRTGPWSDTKSFTISGPDTPTNITSRVGAASGSLYPVTLNWDRVEFASRYEIQVASDDAFTDHLIYYSSNSTEISEILSVPVGEYFARIRSINGNNITGAWSGAIKIEAGTFTKRYGGKNEDRAKEIIPSALGGYIILSDTNSPSIFSGVDSQGDDWIFKLDEQGEIVWQYFSSASGGGRFSDITEMNDGSIVAVGLDRVAEQAVALKLNSQGQRIWEILYKPTTFTELYQFTEVIEFNDTLYVSSVEWGRDSNCSLCTIRTGYFLHTINPIDATVSDPFSIPSITGLKNQSVSKLDVTESQHLLISGTAKSDPGGVNANYEWHGAYLETLDTNLKQITTWYNNELWAYNEIGDTIELSNGNYAVIGRGFDDFYPMISVVNKEGITVGNYLGSASYNPMTPLISGKHSEIFSLMRSSHTYPSPAIFTALSPNLTIS